MSTSSGGGGGAGSGPPASSLFASAWTSPVPFPFHLDTPLQAPAQPSQPVAQPHLRTKRNRPAHDAQPSSSSSSSLVFTPSSVPSASSSAAMSDVGPSQSAKERRAAAMSLFSPASTASFNPSATAASALRRVPSVALSPALLRRMVERYLSVHQYSAAIFYADKLCSLAPASTAALPAPSAHPPLSRLLLLATCLHRLGEHRRAIHALRNRSVVCAPHTLVNGAKEMEDVWRWIHDGGEGDEDVDDPAQDAAGGGGGGDDDGENDRARANHAGRARATQKPPASAAPNSSSLSYTSSSPSTRAHLVLSCWHLLSLCLFHCHDYEEALLALAPDDSALLALLSRFQHVNPSPALLSSLCFLRAEVYSQQQHRTRALTWYLQALHYDAACTPAFDRLIEGRLLSWVDERELMKGLAFTDGMQWLELVYWNKIEQYSAKEEDADAPTAPHAAAADVPMTPVGRRELEGGGRGVVARLSRLSNECGLVDNVELYTSLVYRLYHRYDLTAALTLSSRLLTADPYNPHLLPLHLLLLASTGSTSHLFYISHQLSTSLPQSPLSSYAIALYYFAIRKYDQARRFFSRASTLDSLFLPAYLGFAHAFAAQEEGDQAMIAYRTAARLFEGSHLPLLCLGMEYSRAGNLDVAEELLREGLRVYPGDALTLNELGVLAYRKDDWAAAADMFQSALALIAVTSSSSSAAPLASAWESASINLGHALRKQQRYAQAIAAYRQALAPPAATPAHAIDGLGRSAGAAGEGLGLGGGGGGGGGADDVHCAVLTALGFTYHLMADMERAIQHYHQALATAPRDTLTSDLLTRALQEVAERPIKIK